MKKGSAAAYPAQFGEDGQVGFSKREVIATKLMATLLEKIDFEAYSNEDEPLENAAETALRATDILLNELEKE